jgi:ABC-type nitrate/sulfonate/bicarbonate transport system ATPase subunit
MVERMSADGAVLVASDLSVTYLSRSGSSYTPFSGLNLSIGARDFVCLLGPSGCGKTTLLKALGGLLPASRGGVLFEGRELSGLSPEIVMIFQENNLYPWLTVERNVAFGPLMRGVPKEEVRVITDDLLATVGLAHARRQYPHQLSGGMRQRVAIARALATRSRVLLLDEPFSALDVSMRRRMQKFLRQLWQSAHTAMVMVTHSIEEAILVGERIVVLGADGAGIIEEIDASPTHLKDRYSPDFLSMQRHLERLIGDDDESQPDISVADARDERLSGAAGAA